MTPLEIIATALRDHQHRGRRHVQDFVVDDTHRLGAEAVIAALEAADYAVVPTQICVICDDPNCDHPKMGPHGDCVMLWNGVVVTMGIGQHYAAYVAMSPPTTAPPHKPNTD